MVGILPSGVKATALITGIPCGFEAFYRPMTTCTTPTPLHGFLDVSTIGPKEIPSDLITKLKQAGFHKFFNEVDSFKNRYSCRVTYVAARIYNIGAVRYPEMLGCRLEFTSARVRDEALLSARKIPMFYVASNANRSSMVNTMFAKKGLYAGYWLKLNKYIYVDRSSIQDNARYAYENTSSITRELRYITKAQICFEVRWGDLAISDDIPNINRNLEFAFDIETGMTAEDCAKVDKAKDIVNRFNQIFNICVYAKMGPVNQTYNIYCSRDGKTHDGVDGIVNYCCKNEKELLMQFTQLFERLQPDFTLSFYGSMFDIPMILMKARLANVADIMFARTSIMYQDAYDSRSLATIEGSQYQVTQPKKGAKQYTKWSNIATNPTVSGLNTYHTKYCIQQTEKKFKLEKGVEFSYTYWAPFGSISVDMFLVCSKKFPKETSKQLNSFLAKYKLAPKLDMDYNVLWKIWRENDYAGLAKIYEYCAYDAKAVSLLADKMVYFGECREMAAVTSLPMSVIINQADSVKVATMIYKYASQCSMVCIENYYDTEKEQPTHAKPHSFSNKGAIVRIHKIGKAYALYTPPKGIRADHGFDVDENGDLKIMMAVNALDYASLYPSIQRTYNLSCDTIVFDHNETIGRDFHTHRYNGICYSLDHKDDKAKMGVIPRMHVDMGELRAQKRAEMAKAYARIDEIDKCGNITKELEQERNDCLLLAKRMEAGQLAVKIIMNTVYGATGSSVSTAFMKEIAELTTYYGRERLVDSNTYLLKHDKHLCYNDTDSAYFHDDVQLYADIINDYLLGKIDKATYDRKHVKRAMKMCFTRDQLKGWYHNKTRDGLTARLEKATGQVEIDSIKGRLAVLTDERDAELRRKRDDKSPTFVDELNAHLRELTKYSYLKMVREETLYPAVFCALKRYFGSMYAMEWTEHPEPFFRGLDIRTRKASKYVIEFIHNASKAILSSYRTDIMPMLLEFLQGQYNIIAENGRLPQSYQHFQVSQRYKPNVTKNDAYGAIQTTTLFGQMHPEFAELCKTPDQLEYVQYVCADFHIRKKLNNNKYDKKIRSCLMYTSVAEAAKVDLDWHRIVQSLYASTASFISYHPNFATSAEVYKAAEERGDLEDVIKTSAKKAVEAARSYLEKHFKPKDPNERHIDARMIRLRRVTNFYQNWVAASFPPEYRLIVQLMEKCATAQKLLDQSNKMPVAIPDDADLSDPSAAIELATQGITSLARQFDAISQLMLIQFNQLILGDEPFIPTKNLAKMPVELVPSAISLQNLFRELVVNKQILTRVTAIEPQYA